jgi:hypothetical protein
VLDSNFGRATFPESISNRRQETGSLQFDARPQFDDLIRRDAKELGSVGRIALHPYTEVFTSQSFQAQVKPIYTLDEALTCALTANLQLDFGGNFSLNGVAPRTQLYTGLSQRF